MNPALQQYMMMSAMNQGQSPVGPFSPMAIPGQEMAQQSNFKPLPMTAPRAESPLGNAAMQVAQDDESPDPITRGAERGVEASRLSFDMNEDQRRRAEGEALMSFFANMAASKNPSALGSFSEAMNPALQQYNQARKSAYDYNKGIHIEERNLAKDELARQREARIASSGGVHGTLTPNAQLNLSTKYNNALIKYNNTFNKQLNDAFYSLPESQQTPAYRAAISEQIKAKLAPDLAYVKSLQNFGSNHGISLNDGEPNIESFEAQEMPNDYSALPEDELDARIAQLQSGA